MWVVLREGDASAEPHNLQAWWNPVSRYKQKEGGSMVTPALGPFLMNVRAPSRQVIRYLHVFLPERPLHLFEQHSASSTQESPT